MSELDLGLGVLDHQLVDDDGRNCGKVDDLELDLEHPDGPRVVAVLSGPDAWPGRGRLGRLAAGVAGPGAVTVRVPWQEVREVEASVRLRSTADELGLGRGDSILGPLVERLPGGRL